MSRPATFSLFLPQAGLSWPMLRDRARLLEELGYDGLWLVDHFWANGMPDLDFLEGWTTLAALAVATEKLRLGLMVTWARPKCSQSRMTCTCAMMRHCAQAQFQRHMAEVSYIWGPVAFCADQL